MTPAEAAGPAAPGPIRRILVAVDSSANGRAALETAAWLADRLDAEIEAIHVEDVNLVRLAGLPIGREFRLGSGEAQLFDVTVMEERVRSARFRAQHAFRAVSTQLHVRSHFRVQRGSVAAELVAAAAEADLVILGMSSEAVPGRRLGRTALAVAEQARTSVLLLRAGAAMAGRPLVCYDGAPEAARALALARQIARRDEPVRVLVVAEDPAREQALRAEAEAALRAGGFAPVFSAARALRPAEICSLCVRAGADALMIGAGNALIVGPERAALLERIGCPVLIVR